MTFHVDRALIKQGYQIHKEMGAWISRMELAGVIADRFIAVELALWKELWDVMPRSQFFDKELNK